MTDARFEQLCHAYCDDRLTPDDATELDTTITSDPARAAAFTRIVLLQSALERSKPAPTARTASAGRPSSLSPRERAGVRANFKHSPALLSIAAAVLVGAAALLIYLLAATPSTPEPVDPPSGPSIATLIETTTADALTTPGDLAVEGSEYGPGEYALSSGTAEFMLTNSVNVKLRGDTRLFMHSDMSVSLTRGFAEFVCPDAAKGFTVALPDGFKVVDLGTRFYLDVGESGSMRARVIEGRIRVVPPTGDPLELVAGERAAMDRIGATATRLDPFDPDAALVDSERDARWSDFLRDLVAADDAHFVAPLDGDGDPLLGPLPQAVTGGVTATANRFGRSNGALRFAGSPDYIRYPTGWVQGDYTVSAWVRVQQWRRRGYVVAAQLNLPNHISHQLKFRDKLAMIEAFDTQQDPDIAHRATGPTVELGRWTHLVATHREIDARTFELTLYVDGVARATARYPRPTDPVNRPRNLTIGVAPNFVQPDMAFVGDIDDVVLVNRAMTGDEVDRWYRLSQPQSHAKEQPDRDPDNTSSRLSP